MPVREELRTGPWPSGWGPAR